MKITSFKRNIPITGMLIDFLGFTQTFNILGVLLAVTGITTLKNKIQV